MADIERLYSQSLPARKFVGRCYREEEKQNGTFAHKWREWFDGNLFAPLAAAGGKKELFEDSHAPCGLSRCKQGEPFAYWIGMFLPPDATVPDGYESLDFDAGELAVCWVRGKEPDIYFHCCLDRLQSEGYKWAADKNGVKWCIERYVDSRFTQPDAHGDIILDMCFSTAPR